MTRRRRLVAGVGAGFVLTVITGMLLAGVLGVRGDLLAARALVEVARAELDAGDIGAAGAAFDRAATHFRAGQDGLAALPLRALARLPGARANVVTTRRLAVAGATVAEAGAAVTGAVAGAGGTDAFAPAGGRVPLEPIAALAAPLAAAVGQLATAAALVDGAPASGLVGPVADARSEFVRQLADATDMVAAAAALADQMPAFLGADGPRRYFVGAQNPAELRGTGGLIGAFGILTADRGRITISDFQTITVLTDAAPPALPPPSEDYEDRYGRYSAGVHGSNVNMTPDVPTAAVAIETLYGAVTGERIDGTILADPVFLQALLSVVGPTVVPDVGEVTADDVVTFVTRDQYAVLAGVNEDRKEQLGEVAGAVLRRFLSGEADPRRAISALGAAVADGRLRLHATDPAVQDAFAMAGVDGAMADPDGDYLSVVGNNAAGNKVDTFLEQDVAYDVTLHADGSLDGRLTLALTNTAPTSGFHQTVLGPYVESLVAGQSRTYWSVYCAPGCTLTGHTRDGEPTDPTPETERDRPVFTSTVTLASGESTILEYGWTVPARWDPRAGPAGYELTIDGQPALAQASTTVSVRPGAGVGAIVAAPPMIDQGGAARWQGTPSGRVVLQAGTGQDRSLARRLADLLNRPILDWAVSARP